MPKLNIKWIQADVENQEHALELVELLENVLKDNTSYFKWDYEIVEE
jgi:hypothetical protein